MIKKVRDMRLEGVKCHSHASGGVAVAGSNENIMENSRSDGSSS
jgi:hypothetical protein